MNNPTPQNDFEHTLAQILSAPDPNPRFVAGLEQSLRAKVATQAQKYAHPGFWMWMRPAFQVVGVVLGAAVMIAVLVFSMRLIPEKSVQPSNGQATVSAQKTTTSKPTMDREHPTPQSTPNQQPITYAVKAGDTLEKIASLVGRPAEDIAQLNHLDPGRTHLASGMVLIIGYRDIPTPQPADTIPTSPQALHLESSHKSIRERILQPEWETIWVEGEVRQPNTDGGIQQQITYTQAYLAKDGRGRVLTSSPVPALFNFNLDVGVGKVAISDRQKQVRYDMSTKQADPAETPSQWTLHPLEAVNPVTRMLFPAEMALRSQDVQPLREEAISGRRALVLDWAEDRLWVDEETGLILRQERYAGSDRQQAPLYQAQINRLVMGINLVDAVLHPPYLDELAFEPQPTLKEPPSSNPVENTSQSGWIYLETAGEAPFQWQVVMLPADCLADPQTCPAPIPLPGHPNLQIMGLTWSPDYHLAVFSDTNHSKLISYNPVTQEWQRVLDVFLQNQLSWSPDGSKVAGIGASENGENNRLVVIDRPTWTPRTIDTGLDGTLSVNGWFDEQSLLVGRRASPAKGTGSSDLIAELYRVDLDSGHSKLLVSGASDAAVSPDKQKLAIGMLKDGSTELKVSDADGSNLHSLGVEGGMPSWSPDGQWIVYYDNNGSGINMVHPDGSEVRKNVVVGPMFPPVWSPDGKEMLTQSGEMTAASSWLVKTSVEDGSTQTIPMKIFDNAGIWQLLGWAK